MRLVLPRFYIYCYLSLLLFIQCTQKRQSDNDIITESDSYYFKVKKVVDGDTFWLDDNSAKGLKVRLIGVDAPESRKTFRKEVGYYGKEAKAYLKSILENHRVKLELDIDPKDQYGRTLAYVYREDGLFINAELIKNGYAMVLTVPPNVKYADYFLELQQDARDNQRGLWKQ